MSDVTQWQIRANVSAPWMNCSEVDAARAVAFSWEVRRLWDEKPMGLQEFTDIMMQALEVFDVADVKNLSDAERLDMAEFINSLLTVRREQP